MEATAHRSPYGFALCDEHRHDRRERLMGILVSLGGNEDWETAHQEADTALLDYIDDQEVRAAFRAVGKWYA
jgi:hypothetical protein